MGDKIRIAVLHFAHETVTFLKNDTTLDARAVMSPEMRKTQRGVKQVKTGPLFRYH
jgi:hypothetical protein